MRPTLLLLAVIALAPACKREPTFDERYAATQKRIEAKSQELDAELTAEAEGPEAAQSRR